MQRYETLSLLGAINSNSLKAKPISGVNFKKLLKLKSEMKNYFLSMEAEEKELASALNDIDIADPIYQEKLRAIQSELFEPTELNFLTERELQWNEETGTGHALILTEFLLVKSE